LKTFSSASLSNSPSDLVLLAECDPLTSLGFGGTTSINLTGIDFYQIGVEFSQNGTGIDPSLIKF